MALADSLLADPQQIQGNILRPFSGRYQAFLFLSFRSDRAGARGWLGAAASRAAGTDDVGAARGDPGSALAQSLMNIGLTATGLVLLHPEAAGDLVGFEAFWRGPLGDELDDSGRLTTTAALLGDVGASDPRSWVIGGPAGPPVDALLTVAADDDETLQRRVDQELQAATDAGLAVLPLTGVGKVQKGAVVLNHQERRIEHFGFADSISQPGIRGFHGSGRPGSPVIAAGEFVLGSAGERRPRTSVPRPTPAPWMWGGSFQVFRRLRQDVAGWWDRMEKSSGRDGGTPEEAAARALGRHLDGRPLAGGADPSEPNNFTYRDDELGTQTPRYAHIRKLNPRQDEVFRDRGHKILRRGIPFGPAFDRDQPDNRERGLLFNAYMASIADQFEFLQRRWANDPEFPASTLARYGQEPAGAHRIDGLDPLIGDDRHTARQRLATKVLNQIPPSAFGGFVTTTGAVYAFAPSLRALRLLAGAPSLYAVDSPGR